MSKKKPNGRKKDESGDKKPKSKKKKEEPAEDVREAVVPVEKQENQAKKIKADLPSDAPSEKRTFWYHP